MKTDIAIELKKAGLSHPGRHPFTTNYLPRVLHADERIMAALFGRMKESEGFFGFVEGLLVATDRRVLFLDHRPGYTTTDEVSYDVVSGVNISSTIFNSSVTLFTKIANYKLSFVDHDAAQKFADYIESRVLEHQKQPTAVDKPDYEVTIDASAMEFLKTHETGVLSSIERTGAVSGAAVYYTIMDDHPYFMTKLGTRKADSMMGNQHVAFTVFDETKLQTIQIQGIVELIDDEVKKRFVMTALTHPRTYEDGSHKIPVMRMSNGDFVIFRIVPTRFQFTDFRYR